MLICKFSNWINTNISFVKSLWLPLVCYDVYVMNVIYNACMVLLIIKLPFGIFISTCHQKNIYIHCPPLICSTTKSFYFNHDYFVSAPGFSCELNIFCLKHSYGRTKCAIEFLICMLSCKHVYYNNSTKHAIHTTFAQHTTWITFLSCVIEILLAGIS